MSTSTSPVEFDPLSEAFFNDPTAVGSHAIRIADDLPRHGLKRES